MTQSGQRHWLVLLFLPLVLTAALPDWMFSKTDYIDAWVYHGFFRHLELYTSTMFPLTYYGARLGWIVPGYVAYRLFEPAAATVVLHSIEYLAAVVALYTIIRKTAGPSSALFATCAFGLYLPSVRALGSDYVDGAVITYALVAIALGMAAVDRSSRWLVFASGFVVGAMLNTNVGAAFLLPSILVWLAPQHRDGWRSKELRVRAKLWCGGIVLCTALLVVVSVAVGGEWDFFLFAFRWMSSQRWMNPWDVAGLGWVATSPWVFLPAATLTGSLLTVVVPSRRRGLTPGQVRAIASLAVCGVVFALWDFTGPGALLYWPFYATWLVPWTFLVIGTVFIPQMTSMRADILITLSAVAALAASLAWRPALPGPEFLSLLLTVALGAVAAILYRPLVSRLLIVIAILGLHGWLSVTDDYRPVRDREDAFHAIDRGVRIIDAHLTKAQPRFLLAPLPKLRHYVQGLTSVYLWGYTIVSNGFPAVSEKQAALITPGTTVIVIAERPDAAAPFDEVFAPYGLSGRVIGSESIETMHGLLYLTFVEALSVSRPSEGDAEATGKAVGSAG